MTTAVAAPPASPGRRNRRRRGGSKAPPATAEENLAPLPTAPKSPSKRRSILVEDDESPLSSTVTAAPGTPPKKSKSNGRAAGRSRSKKTASTPLEELSNLRIVTPSETPEEDPPKKDDKKKGGNARARRSLSSNMRSAAASASSGCLEKAPSLASSVASSSSSEDESGEEDVNAATVAETKTKKGAFGRSAQSQIAVLPKVRSAYSAINTRTGSLGGNGHGGAIYGELTVGSMQRMVNMMKEHTEFSSSSRFIDVGCGLGKPNVHVALDPGVEFSYGCEMEGVRWWLGMSNLDAVLQGMRKEEGEEKLRCMLAHADATEAKTFDPFTHVYMFDIGFPPALFLKLAKMYNSSATPRWLICYHGPRLMIDEYGFDVELLAQTSTSMHGSSEGHMGYVYRRTNLPKKAKSGGRGGKKSSATTVDGVPCDPLFRPAYDMCRDMSRGEMAAHVRQVVSDNFNGRNDEGSRRGEGDEADSDGRRRSRRERKPIRKYGIHDA